MRTLRPAMLCFLLPAAAALAFQTAPVLPNLVGHWTLNEAASPAADSANGNSGTWTNGPAASNLTPNVAYSPMCINLDGVDDFVEIGSPAVLQNISAQIGVSAWVNFDSIGAERKVVAKWGDTPSFDACWLLTVYPGSVNFWVFNGAAQAAAPAGVALSTGAWHHLVGTFDGATLRVYIDGVQAATGALAGPMRTSAIPVRIGAGSGTTVAQEEPVAGRIDDVRIYDRAITAAEVTSLYTSMLPQTMTLTATGGSGQIALTWTAAGGATAYEVRRGTSAAGPFAPIATLGAVTTYTDAAVTAGVPYSYLIVATTPTGTVLSNVATATATAGGGAPPGGGGGLIPGSDSPNGNQSINDGCSCGVAGPAPTGAALLSLALLALAGFRTGRRR